MMDELRITQQTGPIRLTMISPADVRVRAAVGAAKVSVGGTPGPPGGAGPQGPPGPKGPPGNLEAGITLDGGNF